MEESLNLGTSLTECSFENLTQLLPEYYQKIKLFSQGLERPSMGTTHWWNIRKTTVFPKGVEGHPMLPFP